MLWKWLTLLVSVAVLVFSILVYNKERKNDEPFRDSVYAYLNAYNSTYATPRPNFYDECPEYNQWVRDANHAGKKIVDECKKKYPGDERCPRYLPWLEAPCASLRQQYYIPI